MVPLHLQWWSTILKKKQSTCTHWNHPLPLFGHIIWTSNTVGAKQILISSPPEDWKRPRATLDWVGEKFKMTLTATNSYGLKQSTWLRTDHCGGYWWPEMPRAYRGACRRRHHCTLSSSACLWYVSAAWRILESLCSYLIDQFSVLFVLPRGL